MMEDLLETMTLPPLLNPSMQPHVLASLPMLQMCLEGQTGRPRSFRQTLPKLPPMSGELMLETEWGYVLRTTPRLCFAFGH